MTDVDFVMNVFERTYREILEPGRFAARAAQHGFPFARRTLLVNNVNDRAELESKLAPLLASGEITEAHFVEERLDEALRLTGLTRQTLEPLPHYSDCSLVAVTLPGSPWLLYVDADVHLAEPGDWITPALRLMEEDRRVAVANPDWTPSCVREESRELCGEYALGYGFSDQIYLLRREEFARPVYGHMALQSWRFPLSHIVPVFEQRVDAYMRVHHRLRATSLATSYVHEGDEGAGYRQTTPARRWKRRAMMQLMRLASGLPGHDPRYHL